MKQKFPISHLTPIQKKVTLENGTEPPFDNEYWDHFEKGLYVDIISGKPLFTSDDKFDSHCGWPSFSKAIDPSVIIEHSDFSYGMIRTEVRSDDSDAHLGHVFDDGPKAMGGLRYCINSASIRFILYDDLDAKGYGDYKKYFKDHE
jgi:peptide-methionine (R)-S-oxide reductase